MTLPANKTKIVCTIGPASESPAVIEQMIRAGMNVARLNFSHGDFASHQRVIENLRAATRAEVLDVLFCGAKHRVHDAQGSGCRKQGVLLHRAAYLFIGADESPPPRKPCA